MKSSLPSAAWFRAMNELSAQTFSKKVRSELEDLPALKDSLGSKLNSFCVWAGKTRLIYEPDIHEEVFDFLSGNFRERQRMNVSNTNQWMRLRKQVFKRDNYTCRYCGTKDGKMECDHVVPFSKGGSDELENLVTACFNCNRRKRDHSLEVFIQKTKEKNYAQQNASRLDGQ